MLTALHIEDFILIDRLSLPVGKGLTALTGETGAGKSILLDALGLAVGGRHVRGTIRPGGERGVVSASFEPSPNHPVWHSLKENGLSGEDGVVILRRTQERDGRSRAFVNDQPVSIGLLRRVGETLLEIHGQHDGQSLLVAATHRMLLDEFGALDRERAAVADAFDRLTGAESALKSLQDAAAATRRREADLRAVAEELESLKPAPGEETILVERRARLMAAEKISEDLAAAAGALDDEGLEARLIAAARRLARAAAAAPAAQDALAGAIERIDQALADLQEAQAAIEKAASGFERDGALLQATDDRLHALRLAARRHGVAVELLPDLAERARRSLDELNSTQADERRLAADAAAAREDYRRRAEALSAARLRAAAALDAAVAAELAPLRLSEAIFTTRVESGAAGPARDGVDDVEFMVRTNAGGPVAPLKAVASGGELSRFILAIKAALAAKEERTVIIFDEVDAGVGGAVADAVGERLARLAEGAQVLVVTHSPQVAARAAAHWRVEKTTAKGETTTRVSRLDDQGRVGELARMLSGAVVTEEALAAAASLLALAQRKSAPASRRKTPSGARSGRRAAS